jgi:hypothetical protein
VGTSVETRAACKQTIAIADMHNIILGSSGCNNSPGTAFIPDIDVFLGIEGYNPLSGGAAGRLDSDTVRQRHGQIAVGVGFLEIVFGDEGKFADVFNAMDILGLKAGLVHLLPVCFAIVIDMGNLLNQFVTLQLAELGCGHGFDLGLEIVLHDFFSCLSSWYPLISCLKIFFLFSSACRLICRKIFPQPDPLRIKVHTVYIVLA